MSDDGEAPPVVSDGGRPALSPRPPRRAWPWTRIRLGLTSLAIVAAVGLAYLVKLPSIQLCTFKAATGYGCPGCGMTRSIVSLCHGDVLTSLRMHPIGVFLGGGLLAAFVGSLIDTATRHRDPVWRWFDRHSPVLAISFIVGMVGVWIVRTFVVPEWAPDPPGEPLGWGRLFGF